MTQTRNRRIAGVALTVGLIAICLVVLFRNKSADRDPRHTATAADRARADDLVGRAERLVESGNGRESRRLIDLALQRDPLHDKARLYRAMFQHEDGQLAEALDTLSGVKSGGENGPTGTAATARYLEGRVLMDLKQARRAEAALQQSAVLNPRYAAPLRQLAGLYSLQLRARDLERVLQQLRLLGPLSADMEAVVLLSGRPVVEEAQATAQLEDYLAADPTDVRSLAALLMYDLIRDQLDQAVRRLNHPELQKLVDTDEELRCVVGLVRLEAGDPESAVSAIRGLALSAESPLACWQLRGRLAEQQSDWTTVRQVFEYLSSALPFDVSVRHRFATASERLNSPDEAIRRHSQADQLDQLERLAYTVQLPRAAGTADQSVRPVIEQIASLLESLGRLDDAIHWWQLLLAIHPQEKVLQEHVSRLQAAQSAAGADTVRTLAPEIPPLKGGSETRVVGSPSSVVVKPFSPIQFAADKPFSTIQFADVASDLGIHFEYFNGQSAGKRIVETVGGGAGVVDFDADGWPDLYFPQGADVEPLPGRILRTDQLYRNMRGAHFSELTNVAGIHESLHSLSCAIGDADNDGFADILVLNLGVEVLFRNQGDGTFVEDTPAALRANYDCSSAGAWADFDSDGTADLYIVNYVTDWDRVCLNSRGEPATCDPRQYEGGQDRVLLNDGQGSFVDVTQDAIASRAAGKGLGVITADFDGDGRIDVYVANDGQPNDLYLNQSMAGSIGFKESAMEYGAAVNGEGRSEAGMGIACADFDGSGTPDLFVTNFYRESNTLYLNRDGRFFEDRTRSSNLDLPSRDVLGFGTRALDADLNGTMDLVVLNGDIDDYSASGRPWKMKPQVFRNSGAAEFEEVSATSGPYFAEPALGRGLSRLDFNNDGRADLIAVHHGRPVSLLHNLTEPVGEPLVLTLSSAVSARDATGAVVISGDRNGPLLDLVCSGGGFAGSDDRRVLCARPAGRVPIQIRWPNGQYSDLNLRDSEGPQILIQKPQGQVVQNRLSRDR